MDDGTVDIDPDLTSTIGDVLLSTKNDKTDANDSTPTSSTDAASSFPGTSLTVSEDPISSTSSDVMERDKLPNIKNENNETDTVASKNLLGADGDVDLLDMNIPNVSSELISEDVEDIVQDLENLLGEPEPHHDFPTRRKEKSPFEETELLASLDDQLSKNVDSNLCPTTSNTQLPEKIEIVEEIESKNDETSVTGESEIRENSILIEQTASEEQLVILEIPHKEEKPEIIDEVNCRSDKLEVAPSGQSEEQTETDTPQAEATKETPENKPEENEVNTVSSSEIVTLSQVPSHSIEENIEGNAMEETEETGQSKDLLKLTGDDDIGSTEKTNNDSQNLQSNEEDQDKISKDLDSEGVISTPQKIENADSVCEKSLETSEGVVISELVSEDDKDAELVETENFEGLQYFITDPSEEVVPSDPSAEILITATEVIDSPIEIIDASTSFVDELICDQNPDLTPSSEEIIRETADSLPEMTDTSVVTTDLNKDILKTDIECDVNVTSSSNLEELEINECSTTKSPKESSEANPEVFNEISECEQLVEPEDSDIVLNDQNVVNEEISVHIQTNTGGEKTDSGIEPVKQIIEQVNLTSSDESIAIVENSGSDSTDTVSEEKSENLSDNIKHSVIEHQVTCEESSTPDDLEQKSLPSLEIVPSEETAIETECVETIGNEPENLEHLTEVKEVKLETPSDESGVEEQVIVKEDISTVEIATTDITSSTNQITESIEEKLAAIPKQELSKENLELQTRDHEIVKEVEAEDILGITEKYNIQSPPDGTLNKEETIEQESTSKSEMISVTNYASSDCKDDENKEIVSSVAEERDKGEERTVTEDISGIEDEVRAEIEQKQESSIQENVPFAEETIIEIFGEDDNTESTGPVEENVEISCSIMSQENINSAFPKDTSETSLNSERNLPDQINADFSNKVSCSISEQNMVQGEVENIQSSETKNKQKTEDVENSSVEKLVPVNEEICIEKVIIYEHDCDSHQATHSNIQIEHEQEESNTEEINEKMDEESEAVTILRIEALEGEIIQAEEDSSNFAQHQTENIPVQKSDVAVEEITQTPVDSSNSPQHQLGYHSENPPVQNTDVVVNEAIQSQIDLLISAEESTQSDNPPVKTTEVDVDEAIQSHVDSSISTQQQSRGQSENAPVQKTEVVVDEAIQSQVDSSNSAQQQSSGQPENTPETELVVDEAIQSQVDSSNPTQEQTSSQSEDTPVQKTEEVVEEAIQSQVDSSNLTHQHSSGQSDNTPVEKTEVVVEEAIQCQVDSSNSTQEQTSGQSEDTPVQKTEEVVEEAIQSQVDSSNLTQQHSSGQSDNTPVQKTEVVVEEAIQCQVDSSNSTQQLSNVDSENPPNQTAEVFDEVNQHSVESSLHDQNNSTAESQNSPLQLIAELPDEEIQPPIDSSVSEKEQLSDEIVEQSLDTSEPSPLEDAKIDEIVEEIEENSDMNEQKESAVVESIISKENENLNQTQDVSSSDQQSIRNIAEETGESETCQPNSTISIEQAAEESSSGAVPEQTMEDQTSAAVQSILENMLTEEKHIEKVIEKEETPVVHSSYSSYEVQKAVQEIQCITQIEEVVEMPPEDIEGISSSEKPCNSETIKYESGSFEAMNVQPDIPESKITEEFTNLEPENTSAIGNIESVVSEEVSDEKVETIQEIVGDLENNQESVTQSSISDQDQTRHAVERIEQQSPIQSKEESSSETMQRSEPVVIPSLDLSEESSSEECSDEDKKQNLVSSSTYDHKDMKIISKNVLKVEKVLSKVESKKHSPREIRHSSRISEKIKPQSLREDMDQPLSVNIDEVEREKPYSPKITIKPIKEDEPNEDKEEHKGSLKITITKQSDNTHSILKMCSPDFEHRLKQSENDEQNVVPKLVIKTSDTHSDQHSPKMSTRSSKQALPTNSNIRSGSPRITIKPIVKPETKETVTSPLKITIKPIGKPEEFSRQQQRHSPKQSKNKTDDDHYSTRSKIMKSSENSDVHSPKVTIKPVKPPEESEMMSTPKITIKPIEKPEEARVSPKITIKPVLRPVELETEVEDEVKERIVLKINKGNLPSKDAERISRESRKRELEEDKSEKLAKIKLKFSKDGDAHIVHKKETDTQSFNKRQHDYEIERSKRFKADATDSDEDVKLIETRQSPIVISEDSQSQDSVIIIEDAKDPLADVVIPKPQVTPPVSAPRKRGRPRKVPLVVREEFLNEPKVIQPTATPISVLTPEQPAETESTGRPKRSCRAQSVRDTLGIKPRKPSKPRGGKRGAGAKSISFKPEKKMSKKDK
ncbi:titin-like isoform X2 [Coccinella septempunctata]|uniref:titin-like isoform X2 n=1 Tax=Coccinella septempunctata TaxID=41139 RepID=UPI001D091978|nr:titin-like isoform X2 [Coccinella septempunctata]